MIRQSEKMGKFGTGSTNAENISNMKNKAMKKSRKILLVKQKEIGKLRRRFQSTYVKLHNQEHKKTK